MSCGAEKLREFYSPDLKEHGRGAGRGGGSGCGIAAMTGREEPGGAEGGSYEHCGGIEIVGNCVAAGFVQFNCRQGGKIAVL